MSSSTITRELFTVFKTSQVSVEELRLTGVLGIDQVAEVAYEQGRVLVSTHVVSGPSGAPRELGAAEVLDLLKALERETINPPPALDGVALQAWIGVLQQLVGRQSSHMFDGARFGDVVRDVAGAIVGHVGVGVDVAGTIHDQDGSLSAERHMAQLSPGPFRPLSSADRASLASALEAFLSTHPPANPLWTHVLADARR